MSRSAAWLAVAATVLLTVYTHLIIKHQVMRAGAFDGNTMERLGFLIRLALNPWVLSGIAGGLLSGFLWMAAMTRLPLNVAYPFLSLSLVLVLIGSSVLFGEPLTARRIAGAGLVLAGLILANHA